MIVNFPAIIKSKDLLSPENLVREIREGNLIEAQLPNGILTLSDNWLFIVFEWITTTWEKDKRALLIHPKTDEELVERVRNLIPVETREEREERMKTEYDIEKYWATKLEEMVTDEIDFESYSH